MTETEGSICPAGGHCLDRQLCDHPGRRLCVRLHHRPIDELMVGAPPVIHLVGFRGEEWWSAVRVFCPREMRAR